MSCRKSSSADNTIGDAMHVAWRLIRGAADRCVQRHLGLAVCAVLVGATVSALTPVVFQQLLDTLAIPAALLPVGVLTAYLLSHYIVRALNELRTFAHGVGTQRLTRRLGDRLFGHLMQLPARFHLDRRTGAVGEALEQGQQGLQTLVQHALFTFLPVTVEFLGIALILIHFEHTEYLAILAPAATAYVFAFWHGAKSIIAPSSAAAAAHMDAYAALTDSLLNYEAIKHFTAEGTMRRRYEGALAKVESEWRKLYLLRLRQGLAIGAIFTASLAISLFQSARETIAGTMTVGTFVLINSYVLRIVQPLEVIGFAVRDVSQAIGFLQQMLQVLREAQETDVIAPSPEAGTQLQGAIEFENVAFGYTPDRPVLQDVSFRVAAGHTLGIVGASGSGKSTLVRLLFRFYAPSAGRILVGGVPIDQLPLQALRRSIAVVPQEPVLFNETIADNIAFGKENSSRRDVEDAARIANLHAFIASLPDGYESQVGERGLKVSGGERQRVAIARAALKQPSIFVFDEATSSLDTHTEQEILANLIAVSRKSTTLIIAHRLSTVVHADQIIVLENGRIVERGTHAELLAAGGSYARTWIAQQNAPTPPEPEAPETIALTCQT